MKDESVWANAATPAWNSPPTKRTGLAVPATMAKLLIVVGLLIVGLGLILLLAGRVPWIGRLPGDIYIRRGNWTFYFPLATSLIISLILTLILWWLGRRQ